MSNYIFTNSSLEKYIKNIISFLLQILLHYQGISVCQINFLILVKTHSAYHFWWQFVCYLTRKLILTVPQSPARVRRIIRDRGEARELFKKSITLREKRRAGFAFGTRPACFFPGVRKRFIPLGKHEHIRMLQKKKE